MFEYSAGATVPGYAVLGYAVLGDAVLGDAVLGWRVDLARPPIVDRT